MQRDLTCLASGAQPSKTSFRTAKGKALLGGTRIQEGAGPLESCDPEKDLGVGTALLKLPLRDTRRGLHLEPAHWVCKRPESEQGPALTLLVGPCPLPLLRAEPAIQLNGP